MRLTGAFYILCLLTLPAQADLSGNVGQCGGLVDLELRLACFDALKQVASTSEEASSELGEEIASCGGGELKRLDCFDAIARQHTDSLAVATDDDSGERKKRSKDKKSSIPKTFTSILTGARRGMTGVWMLELENGDVWRELEPTPGSNYRVGDELTFKKGYFGAYRVKNERTNIGTKVKNLRR